MIRSSTQFLLLLLASAVPALAANSSRISSKDPIINFTLPTFTNPDGHRQWLIRGSEAWMTEENVIDVKGLSLTVFRGDASNQINTMMLSPAARVLPDEKIVTGDSTLRVINLSDGIEVTGENWRYADETKTITLAKNVRVILQAEFKNILK